LVSWLTDSAGTSGSDEGTPGSDGGALGSDEGTPGSGGDMPGSVVGTPGSDSGVDDGGVAGAQAPNASASTLITIMLSNNNINLNVLPSP